MTHLYGCFDAFEVATITVDEMAMLEIKATIDTMYKTRFPWKINS